MRASRTALEAGFDPAAAEDEVAVVEDRGLAGSDGALRRLELDLGRGAGERADARAGAGMTVADTDVALEDIARPVRGDPVHAAHGAAAREERLLGTDDDARRCRLDRDDVEG